MKSILTILISIGLSGPAIAGNEGHGEGDVAKLLHEAKNQYILPIFKKVKPNDSVFAEQPELQEVYKNMRANVAVDLKAIELKQVSEKLKDVISGYPTWISINVEEKKIFYNSVSYIEQVRTAPTRDIMIESLLHELGHFYSLDEDGSWSMARKIIYAYKRPQVVEQRKYPQQLAHKIEMHRQQIEQLLHNKFEIVNRETIARIHGSLEGKLEGSMRQYSPLSMAALHSLLGAAAGGGAGYSLAGLASLPFLASPPGMALALAGAAVGGVIGGVKGANTPTGEASLTGEATGSLEGYQVQTFNVPTLYTTSVVDLDQIAPFKQAMTKYQDVSATDCTFKAVNLLANLGNARASLSVDRMKSLVSLVKEYNQSIGQLKMIYSENVMNGSSGGLSDFIKMQDDWRLSKRIIVVKFDYKPKDSFGKCADSDDEALKAVTAKSKSFETFLVAIDQVRELAN